MTEKNDNIFYLLNVIVLQTTGVALIVFGLLFGFIDNILAPAGGIILIIYGQLYNSMNNDLKKNKKSKWKMATKVLFLFIIILAGTSFFWFSIDGYLAFKKHAKGINEIVIHSQTKLYAEVDKIREEGSIKTYNEIVRQAHNRAILKNITNKAKIEAFVTGIKPSFFSFNLLGCMCGGDPIVTYKYDDGSTFKFGIAHGKTIKMSGYRDLSFVNNLGDLLPALPLDEE